MLRLFLFPPGIFPQHIDLTQLQGLPPALLGQQLYPLSATGHPLLPPRTNTQMQLAAMQQQLQQQRPSERKSIVTTECGHVFVAALPPLIGLSH